MVGDGLKYLIVTLVVRQHQGSQIALVSRVDAVPCVLQEIQQQSHIVLVVVHHQDVKCRPVVDVLDGQIKEVPSVEKYELPDFSFAKTFLWPPCLTEASSLCLCNWPANLSFDVTVTASQYRCHHESTI